MKLPIRLYEYWMSNDHMVGLYNAERRWSHLVELHGDVAAIYRNPRRLKCNARGCSSRQVDEWFDCPVHEKCVAVVRMELVGEECGVEHPTTKRCSEPRRDGSYLCDAHSGFYPWKKPMRLGQPTLATDNRSGVYLMQMPSTERVKIGFSTKVGSRCRSLSASCGENLIVLAVLEGASMIEERALHRRFEFHRLVGEWFRPAPEIFEAFGVDLRSDMLGSSA